MLDAYVHDTELQKCYEKFTVFYMVKQLNRVYLKQARTERYEITKQLWECKMAEGSSIREHVMKLVGYAQRLSALRFAIPTTLNTDILLASPPPPVLQRLYHELQHEWA